MDTGDIKKFYEKALQLDSTNPKDRILLEQICGKIESYRNQLVNFSIVDGWKGNDDFIEEMENMIAEIKKNLQTENQTSSFSINTLIL